MSINKQSTLGTRPLSSAIKDAVHVAIVSGYTSSPVKPGDPVYIDTDGFIRPIDNQPWRDKRDNGPARPLGVADPFRGHQPTGSLVWVLVNPNKVPTVRHEWDLEGNSPAPIPNETKVPVNQCLSNYAKTIGVTLPQLLDACQKVYAGDPAPPYPGSLKFEDEDLFTEVLTGCTCEPVSGDWFEPYDIWSEWGEEFGIEFENYGSACCPEYEHPSGPLFTWVEPTTPNE